MSTLSFRLDTSSIGLAALALFAAGASPLSGAAEPGNAVSSLADMSLEALAEIQVFSASRHLEPTIGVANAIFVLTGEDLQRSGVTSIPQALRLVPGVQVGRVDANKWAVSIRGFNSREANKLLVLVDGRSIYDPLFSGMLWESHDFVLEDIERIEVIRGPGGTLWGANAFNGVINIITRHTDQTSGTLASVTAGDEERYIAVLRHGWSVGDRHTARLYGKARERDTGYSELHTPSDGLRDVRGGFRWDWIVGASDEVRVSGDLFNARSGTRETPGLEQTIEHHGHNLLVKWERRQSARNDVRLQFYYDHVDYDSIAFLQERDTYDLEFQQSLQVSSGQRLVWGGGYRRMRDHAVTGLPGLVDVLPARRDDAIETIFLQDSISLVPDTLQLILGIKYENTGYAGPAWLPNLRFAFTPGPEQTWWASVSEATRVPSRLEADLTFQGSIRIGDEFNAENVRAFEAGHRRLVSAGIWYDIAIFYNDYSNLRTTEASGLLANSMHGHTTGTELALRWEPKTDLRLDASYTYLDMDLGLDSQSTSDPALAWAHEGLAPRHQLAVRAIAQLRDDLEVDATVRYADELPTLEVPDYTQLDLALHWRPVNAWEFSFVGTNLLDSHQPEQGFPFSSTGMPTEVERGWYLRAAWRRDR